MNMLLLKSLFPLAASSVVFASLASCDKKDEPNNFSPRALEPGIGPTKSTGDGKPVHPEPPVPPAGPGTSDGTGSGTGDGSGDGSGGTNPPATPPGTSQPANPPAEGTETQTPPTQTPSENPDEDQQAPPAR